MRRQSFFTESFQSSEHTKSWNKIEEFKTLVLDNKPSPEVYKQIWTECLDLICEKKNVVQVKSGGKLFYKWSIALCDLYENYLPKQGMFRTDLANLSLDNELTTKVVDTFGVSAAYNTQTNFKRTGNYLYAYFDEECYNAVNKAFYNMLLDEVKECS